MQYKRQNTNSLILKQDYSKQIIFSLKDFESKGHLLQLVTIPPQTKQRLHIHNRQTEVYYILEGEAYLFVNDKEIIARSGDAFIISRGEKHRYWNKTNNEFKQVVFKLNMPETDEDTTWLE